MSSVAVIACEKQVQLFLPKAPSAASIYKHTCALRISDFLLVQVWLGGSPDLDGRTGWAWKDKVKESDMEKTVEPVLYMWKSQVGLAQCVSA
jgi:hypothetical protein